MTILPSGAKPEGSSMAASRMRQMAGKVRTARANGPSGEIMTARKMRLIPTTRSGRLGRAESPRGQLRRRAEGIRGTTGAWGRAAPGPRRTLKKFGGMAVDPRGSWPQSQAASPGGTELPTPPRREPEYGWLGFAQSPSSAPLEEKGREESRHDIEDGHSEDVDEPEAHVEEPRGQTVLPGPISVFGVATPACRYIPSSIIIPRRASRE